MKPSRFKFRAWSEKNKIMSSVFDLSDLVEYYDMGYYVRGGWDNRMSIDSENNEKWKKEDDIVKCEIMQSTGLLDKNGKEIFEGDIVRVDYDIDKSLKIIAPETFTNGLMQMSLERYMENKNGENDIFLSNDSRSANNGDAEIIGNKFENKELLI